MNPASIKEKLKNVAKREGKPFDYLLTLYLIERFLYRLSISRYADKFVLKGGVLLYTILDEKARATKDVDMLARELNNSLENFSDILREICTMESDDALFFDVETLSTERIKEDAAYEGVRVKISAFLDRTKKVLQMDIGFGDIVVPGAVRMEYPSLLEMEQPVIQAYSIESVIAEKFEAMIFLAEFNSRMKDFYDICSLANLYDFEGAILQSAITSTFMQRKTKLLVEPAIFTEEYKVSEEKNRQWDAFKRRIASTNEWSFEDVIGILVTFLQPIYDAVVQNQTFEKSWDAGSRQWISK
jgi:Domain of unknown function (DUF1814).